MKVYEATIKAEGDRWSMSEPTINDDVTSVDDWADEIRRQEYGLGNVTEDWRGVVQLPASVLTDRHIAYFAVLTHPDDEAVVYAVWEDE